MSVLLVPTEREDTLELCFGIRVKTGEVVSEPDFSAESSRRYIPDEHRKTVLAYIFRCVTMLGLFYKSDYITMETFYPNLEPKALRKYDGVTQSLERAGYTLRDQFRNPEDGIDYWLYEKRK